LQNLEGQVDQFLGPIEWDGFFAIRFGFFRTGDNVNQRRKPSWQFDVLGLLSDLGDLSQPLEGLTQSFRAHTSLSATPANFWTRP
tara:strand:- start:8127 stop:8381 length:255 start_codon:yes stop_codon:yes gene_type:complete